MPGTLIRILDAYFASNTSTTKQKLFTSINAHINKCPKTHLDKNEKANLKNVLKKFITRRHEALCRRYVTHLQNRQWDELKADIATFSNVTQRHMTRMRVYAPDPSSCVEVLARASANFGFSEPSDGYLTYFVDLEYPEVPDSVIAMSEFAAKAKMVSYFKLMDAARKREAAWALLLELSLFSLSSKSDPSEVKTRDDGTDIINSTFLTGRADMAIVTFKAPDAPTAIVKHATHRRAILNMCKLPSPKAYIGVKRPPSQLLLLKYPHIQPHLLLCGKRQKDIA
ncbi:hypothetical protein P691DRAFT_508801 [Macrolepiota fuliginosa MF-IS2]|uniref:Uncharacterized protein n=1 Tax=Macrolepiota fuliginosa MF-IS2 TaxID=1400762 RepID=A0A9P6C6B2_9AGAR|nr:hypothetical protein P691DRAFT_508801 [Macrolepiota fuliginosa MF-IS2]